MTSCAVLLRFLEHVVIIRAFFWIHFWTSEHITSGSNFRCTLVQKRTSEVMYNEVKCIGITFASHYIFGLWLFQKPDGGTGYFL